jgi:hypothetical protein
VAFNRKSAIENGRRRRPHEAIANLAALAAALAAYHGQLLALPRCHAMIS